MLNLKIVFDAVIIPAAAGRYGFCFQKLNLKSQCIRGESLRWGSASEPMVISHLLSSLQGVELSADVCCIVYTLPLEPKGSEGKGMVPALLLTSPVHRALVPGNARPELKSYRHIKSHVAFLHVNIRVAPKLLRPRDVKGIQVSHMRSQNV